MRPPKDWESLIHSDEAAYQAWLEQVEAESAEADEEMAEHYWQQGLLQQAHCDARWESPHWQVLQQYLNQWHFSDALLVYLLKTFGTNIPTNQVLAELYIIDCLAQ